MNLKKDYGAFFWRVENNTTTNNSQNAKLLGKIQPDKAGLNNMFHY